MRNVAEKYKMENYNVENSSLNDTCVTVTDEVYNSGNDDLACADELKGSLPHDGYSIRHEGRIRLQNIYTHLLVNNLEFALDKKVEQELWNTIFKQPVNELQNQIRNRSNPRRMEAQITLGLLLDQATGFYLSLLQQICEAHQLELPCRTHLPPGVSLDTPAPPLPPCVPQKAILQRGRRLPSNQHETGRRVSLTVRDSSSAYVCQHCVVHLGDVARYAQSNEEARKYYTWAARIAPSAGHPYNQLAILCSNKSNRMGTVFFYMRAMACTTPFPAASSNLEKLYERLCRESPPVMPFTSGSYGAASDATTSGSVLEPLVSAFLQFHAALHLHSDLDRARLVWERFIACLPNSISSFSRECLLHMVAIHIFALHKHTSDLNKQSSKHVAWTNRLLQASVGLLDALCKSVMRLSDTEEMKNSPTLASLLILLLWYQSAVTEENEIFESSSEKDSKTKRYFHLPTFGYELADFLNRIQGLCIGLSELIPSSLHDETSGHTLNWLKNLPELQLLQGFLPLSLPAVAGLKLIKPDKPIDPDLKREFSKGPSSVSHSERRVAGLVWAAREIAHHQSSLLECTSTDRDGILMFTAVRPASPPTPIPPPPVELSALGTTSSTRPVALVGGITGPASGKTHVRNVAIESILQQASQAHQTAETTKFNSPLPAVQTNIAPVTVKAESPSEVGRQEIPPPTAPQQPGLIINADIARFIQEQAAHVAGNNKVAGNTGFPRRLAASSADSGACSMTGSPLTVEPGRSSPASGDANALRQLYNQNRDHFQRDLPPRFARKNVQTPSFVNETSIAANTPLLSKKESEPLFSREDDTTGLVPPPPPPFFFQPSVDVAHAHWGNGQKQEQSETGVTESSSHGNFMHRGAPPGIGRDRPLGPWSDESVRGGFGSHTPSNPMGQYSSHVIGMDNAMMQGRPMGVDVSQSSDVDPWSSLSRFGTSFSRPGPQSGTASEDPMNKVFSGNVQSLWASPLEQFLQQQQRQQMQHQANPLLTNPVFNNFGYQSTSVKTTNGSSPIPFQQKDSNPMLMRPQNRNTQSVHTNPP